MNPDARSARPAASPGNDSRHQANLTRLREPSRPVKRSSRLAASALATGASPWLRRRQWRRKNRSEARSRFRGQKNLLPVGLTACRVLSPAVQLGSKSSAVPCPAFPLECGAEPAGHAQTVTMNIRVPPGSVNRPRPTRQRCSSSVPWRSVGAPARVGYRFWSGISVPEPRRLEAIPRRYQ